MFSGAVSSGFCKVDWQRSEREAMIRRVERNGHEIHTQMQLPRKIGVCGTSDSIKNNQY
jgi:hypothetical protein